MPRHDAQLRAMTESNQPNHILVTPELLLTRLEAIAGRLSESGHAMGLLGLGSVGNERSRLDNYSDLDFFVIVEVGHKGRYIGQLDWLAAAHPLAWHFQNTVDGHKALMTDGVFCEFAVFEPNQVAPIPYSPGRWIWRRDDLPPNLSQPEVPTPSPTLPDESWIVGEALSCLFIGLQRWHRGERLSAARLIQSHAVDRLIELDALRAGVASDDVLADPFNHERRLERLQPSLAIELPMLVPGYARTPQAALAVLSALEHRCVLLNPAIVERIRALATAV
jgi:hypothetical protein